MTPVKPPGTGLPALDAVLQGLRPGDNVVWQVDSLEDYAPLVLPFVARARAEGRRIVYFRFARHEPLLDEASGAEIHRISPALGFESFTDAIHDAIEAAGPGAYHVFDCLSDLAADWYSDLMLGNFFMVTCPYLFELDTVTYFALLSGHHAAEAVDAVRHTTQILIDVFRRRRTVYLHPLKVDGRHSPTMYLPHVREGDGLRPLTESAELAEALCDVADRRLDAVEQRDVWDRRIEAAREVRDAVRKGRGKPEEERSAFESLLRMMLTRDDRFAEMAGRHLTIDDLLAVRRRMVGTGLVGGKAAGMLVARAILANADPAWGRRLEPHDSWFIGSDVFYTYLVRNGCWSARREQRRRASYLEGAAEARRRVTEGTFPDFVLRRFVSLLEYYGQSPIIVRSSSLLEDGFGNAFTGKYESVFCPNQGSPEERLRDFLAALKKVYASAMSEEALHYRERRGLLDRDEQMAVLVQRVSGAVHGDLYFPQLAGVALSYNSYVWNAGIDPQAGVMRLVFGLGTRAVERSDDDYTRLVALNAPSLRPESTLDEKTEYAQHRVDVLDLAGRRLTSVPFPDAARSAPALPLRLFGTRRPDGGWVLTFDELLWGTPLVEWMRELLSRLREAYQYPVDVEFTGNFLADGELRLNLVQCRPLQVREGRRHRPAAVRPARGARAPPVAGPHRRPERAHPHRPGHLRGPRRLRAARHPGSARGGAGHRPAHAARAGGGPAGHAARAGAMGNHHGGPGRPGLLRRDPAGLGALRDHAARGRGPRRVARLPLLQRPGRGEHALRGALPGPPRARPRRGAPAPGREPAPDAPARRRPDGAGGAGDRVRDGRRGAGALAQLRLRPPGGGGVPRTPSGRMRLHGSAGAG